MLIGISGKRRSGKDTVGTWLDAWYGFTKLHLTAPLRGVLLHDLSCPFMFNLDEFGVRDKYVELGMEVRRFTDGNGWLDIVKAVISYINEAHSTSNTSDKCKTHEESKTRVIQDTVICDIRYINEAEAVRRLGGEVWRIEREGIARCSKADRTASETELDCYQFDKVFRSSTLHSLASDVAMYMSQLGYTPMLCPVIYISLNIAGVTPIEAKERGKVIASRLQNFDVVTPDIDWEQWLHNAGSKGLRQAGIEIVREDLKRLAQSHAVLALWRAPSIGMAMEVAVAKMIGMPVVSIVDTMSEVKVHPWLWCFSDWVFTDIEHAIEQLEWLFATEVFRNAFRGSVHR